MFQRPLALCPLLLLLIQAVLASQLWAGQPVVVEGDGCGERRADAGPPRPLVDLDAMLPPDAPAWIGPRVLAGWRLRCLPQGFIYREYLAGPKQTRLSSQLVSIPGESSTMWDASVGARVGVFRLGTADPFRPSGLQADVEASAQVRLDLPDDRDVQSVDFRLGLPLTWGDAWRQWKFGYYHLSSHLGDEFLAKNPGFPRFGQSRDVLVLGCSQFLTDALRVYVEVGWAFASDASEPWEIQFGADWAPRGPTGPAGAPFLAAHGQLRQELNFGGGATIQAGWAWRSEATAGLLRFGLHYYNGASPQYAFLPFHEQQIGLGLWYDF